MKESELAELKEAVNAEIWRPPDEIITGFDGVAWELMSYKADGSIDKSSGPPGYIWGNVVLEAIVSLLPPEDEMPFQ